MKIGAKAGFDLPKKGPHNAILAECVEFPDGKFGANAALIFLIDEVDDNDEPRRVFFFFRPDIGFGSPKGKGTAFRHLIQNLKGKVMPAQKLEAIAKDGFDATALYGLKGKIFIKHKASEDKDGNEKIYSNIDPELCEPGENDLSLDDYTPWEEVKRKNARKNKGSGQQRSAKKRTDEEEEVEEVDDDSDFSALEDDDDDDRTKARKISSGKSKTTKEPW